jgi:O-antigen/teichoic acid export membrane protein
LSGIKKLAGQTMWYGVSSILARFITFLLTPYLTSTSVLAVSDYGKMSLIYAALPLLNVLFTYGFETAYFRFAQRKEYSASIYSTASISLFLSTMTFSLLLWLFKVPLANMAGVADEPQLLKLAIIIIALDTITALPFASLRLEGRPVKYAVIRISSILLNVAATVFFLTYCPKAIATNEASWIHVFYRTDINPVTYILIANLLSSGLTLLLLINKIGSVRLEFNTKLWKEMMVYALPLVIVGLGGMINETVDRLMLNWWTPGTEVFKSEQVGIYSACYKLSLLISLFIQAFRMGAEPFFFKQAEGLNPQRTYARVMKFFVITVTLMFLVVTLYLPVIKIFIGSTYWVGLGVVPILLLANIFLGIYYNLSIWYKLSNKTKAGALITLIGVVITTIINYLFIPAYGYFACAWATFFCYGSMMVISFLWGQKEYKIPYPTKKLIAYIIIVVVLFFIHKGIDALLPYTVVSILVGSMLLFVYVWFLLLIERKEFQKLPVVGKFIK